MPALLIEAQRVAHTVTHGSHGRRRAGPGETFWQFRHFDYNDSRAGIDWRRSGSSDHLFVREREWEAAHPVWLWVDLSPSMRFRSRLSNTTKESRAVVLWLALGVAVAVAGWRIPGAFRDARQAVLGVRGLTPVERTLLPARSFDISTELFVAAAQHVPPEATFYVATGDGIEVSSPVVLPKTPIFAAYWLLPRRMTTDPRQADWVLSYGGALTALGLDYVRVIDVASGQQLAEVRR